jgi:C-methyltransferase C-terminal domain/Putative zinc binding domain/Methyltransferase domain
MVKKSECRFCGVTLKQPFLDLGMSPIANANIKPDDLEAMERFYPLRVYVCENCLLVQLGEFQSSREIFSNDYPYFSSVSSSWLEHARQYSLMIIARLGLTTRSQVIEIASNDGYLLRNFKEKRIKVLGVEPAANAAKAAQLLGIPSLVDFFGVDTAKQMVADGVKADLLIGNNVLPHVPDLNDFVEGQKLLLADTGVITMEFPHLMQLMSLNQFDTIYHEHFSYFSLMVAERVLAAHGLVVFDVEELPTHGGSLRVYACHDSDTQRAITDNVGNLRAREDAYGFRDVTTYYAFAEQVRETKRRLLQFLIEQKSQGKSIAAYGAPAKGNTLLNYCGIRDDYLDYTVDLSPHKQGMYLPGTHLPIYAPDRIKETKPDYVLVLPWNLKEEIIAQMAYIREWGGKFVVPIPQVEVLG